MFTPEILKLYFVIAIGGVLVSISLILVALTWPQAVPLMLATLISTAVILAYVAWQRSSR